MAAILVSGWAFGDTPDLTGTWGEACLLVPGADGDLEAYYRINHTFNDPFGATDQNIVTVSLYNSSECQQPFRIKVYVSKYSVGEEFGEGLKFDVATSHILLTSFAKKDVDMMNITSKCGFNDWQVGVTKLVDDKRCHATRSKYLVEAPLANYYTIIGFNQTEDNKPYLLFGKHNKDDDSSSEQDRPKTLDTSRKFFRR